MTKENVKENGTTQEDLVIVREINASRHLVWKANTEAEHLANWWGPKGLKMISCKVDLRPGGMFHYGMQTPDGNEMWGKFVYREVKPEERLVFVVSFSDKNAGTTRHPMSESWPLEMLNTITLEEKNGKTILTLRAAPINAQPEEAKIFYSSFAQMDQGFKGTYDQLDEYLSELKSEALK